MNLVFLLLMGKWEMVWLVKRVMKGGKVECSEVGWKGGRRNGDEKRGNGIKEDRSHQSDWSICLNLIAKIMIRLSSSIPVILAFTIT